MMEKNFWDITVDRTVQEAALSDQTVYDVIVVGGGASGLLAAVRAAECGASVAILDKMKVLGGTGRCPMGIFGVGTNAQKRLGIEESADEAFLRHMTVNQWSCDARLVREWMSGSRKVMNWLEAHGMDFDVVGGCSGPILTYHMCHYHTGFELVNHMLDDIERLGVSVFTGQRAFRILKDDSGRVSGVLARSGDVETTFYGKSVILATGSLAKNPELLKKFFPDRNYGNVKCMGAMGFATGDGYYMAAEAGGASGRVSPNYIGPHNHPRDVYVGALLRRPHMMIVNKLGERYVDENIFSNGDFGWMSGKALEEQPGRVCYPIMDSQTFRDMLAHPMVASEVEGNQTRHDPRTGLLDPQRSKTAWLSEVESHMPKEIEDGMMKICDTLEEVAEYIGCDVDTLKQTIERYNGFCDKGKDEDFLKDPLYLYPVRQAPYYVFTGLHGIDNFIGGIKINWHMQVITPEAQPIPGLYACGIATSGWLGYGYGHAGSEMGLSTFSGYTSGENAAAYARSLRE
jgi:fumarate reductase flavoprotein subunit